MSPIKNTLMSLWSRKAIESKMIVTIASVAFLLSACGESGTTENITQINQSNMDVVMDVSLLPPCSATNEGELVWVRNEATPRMCSGGLWYAVAEGSVAATCSTQPLLDGSGVKILCGGDSIGVVLNGKDGAQGKPGVQGKQGVAGKDGADGAPGADGKDGEDGADGNDGAPGAGCSMEKIDELSVRVTCGTESTVLYVGELPDTAGQGEVVLDSEKIAISLDEVSGVTQKGPFLSGSKVLVREMEDGRTLSQTGNSFNGKILNDNGEFKINARMLVSQYVMLEATGYYRNEVTGENSNSELTLFAITDVNDRNIVNVNLLTHLEYERVIYLVTQKKMKVRAAKKQAQKEVFGLLNIDATNFSNSEDLNIAGASDEDAALLAFSIILQGDRSVSQLSELLQKIATDMETDGVWDDEARRSELADFAAAIDSSDRIQRIRTNVEGWGLSSIVPNFEKHVRKFWTTEFGMGECNDENIGKVVAANKGIATRRYICRADSLWHVASDFEKDTYQWKDSTDGALKAGAITGKTYVFDSTGVRNGGVKGWREAAYLEGLYGGCNKKLYGAFRYDNKQGGYYQCQEQAHDWVLFKNDIMIDTQLWSEGEDGYAKWGDSIGVVTSGSKNCYVYDTSAAYRGWRAGTNNDCSLGLLGCTEGRSGKMLKSPVTGEFYNCVNNFWRKIDDRILLNTAGWDCLDSNDGEMKLGLVHDAYFVCDYYEWRDATNVEETNCRSNGVCQCEKKCDERRIGKFEDRDGVKYVCDDYEWREANCAEIKRGTIFCDSQNQDVEWDCEDNGNFKIDYVCREPGGGMYPPRMYSVSSPIDYSLENWNKKKAKYYTAEAHPGATYGEDLVDNRDGNVYKTVYINGMRVMAENLRFADSVSMINLKGQTDCLRNGENYCLILGTGYTGLGAANVDTKWYYSGIPKSMLTYPHQGVCPDGWHLPTCDELEIMRGSDESFMMQGFTAFHMALDSLGFSAIPTYANTHYGSQYSCIDIRNDVYDTVNTFRVGGGMYFSSSYSRVRCIENYAGTPVANPYLFTPEQWNSVKSTYYTSENNPDAEYGEDLIDERDGNVYKTVYIKNKRWMAENLRYADSATTENLKDGVEPRRIGSEVASLNLGLLYRWEAAMDLSDGEQIPADRRGICPEGWHIPDTTEWKDLESFDPASLQMKRIWRNFKNGTDDVGFSAMAWQDDSYWSRFTGDAFWSSISRYIFIIKADEIGVRSGPCVSCGESIRCIQDYPVDP